MVYRPHTLYAKAVYTAPFELAFRQLKSGAVYIRHKAVPPAPRHRTPTLYHNHRASRAVTRTVPSHPAAPARCS